METSVNRFSSTSLRPCLNRGGSVLSTDRGSYHCSLSLLDICGPKIDKKNYENLSSETNNHTLPFSLAVDFVDSWEDLPVKSILPTENHWCHHIGSNQLWLGQTNVFILVLPVSLIHTWNEQRTGSCVCQESSINGRTVSGLTDVYNGWSYMQREWLQKPRHQKNSCTARKKVYKSK